MSAASGATITVTNVADAGPGTLRAAITNANFNAGADVIEFDLPASGPFTITPLSGLPAIIEAVTIDGTTQPGYAEKPLVQLNGTGAANSSGLLLNGAGSGGSVVRGLTINRFPRYGLEVIGSDNNVIEGCFIGTDTNGTAALPNGGGILLKACTNNRIGSTNATGQNIISGNTIDGVYLEDLGGHRIVGNYIGLGFGGSNAVPNLSRGLLIKSSTNNLVGGYTAAERNVISGNGESGVGLADVATSNNVVAGNFIGLNAAGTAALGNTNSGVLLTLGARFNLIGGTNAGAGNVISGNRNQGVDVSSGTGHNVIQGNFIGTAPNGLTAFPNLQNGVVLFATTNNLVGGETPAARNFISGNAGDGVNIGGASARGNRIIGNFIGPDFTGTNRLANGLTGVAITNAPLNFIGEPGVGNLISGNTAQGISLFGANATGNKIAGNWVGLDATGQRALTNNFEGIWLVNAPANEIGLAVAGGGNVFSGNGKFGIFLQGDSTSNVIAGNFVGPDASGTLRVGNGAFDGVVIDGVAGVRVGGTSAAARNVISGNNQHGLAVYGAGASNTVIQGNYIGTSASGLTILSNALNGIAVGNGAGVPVVFNTQIGGSIQGAGNLVSGNGSAPLYRGGIFLGKTHGTVIEGNLIGVAADGLSPLGNFGHAVELILSTNTLIGGTSPGAGNIIANTTADQRSGIRIRGAAQTGVGNYIQGNSIYNNRALGIAFSGATATANDPNCDGDGGANLQQNYPILTNAVASPAATVVKGWLDSAANQIYRLQFYANPAADNSGYGEGQLYLGEVVFIAGGACSNNFSVSLPAGVPAGWRVAATATDPFNNTSEFSPSLVVASASPLFIAPPTNATTTISWLVTNPNSAAGGVWQLTTASNLLPPVVWSPASGTPEVLSNGTFFRVTQPATNLVQFYRLQYQ